MHGERGFTLVELMVAALVLLVGLLSVVGVLNTAMRKTSLNHQRVAATNLARELTEAARTADYDTLTPTSAAAAIQAADPNIGSGSPWTVVRQNTTYTITVTVCTYDDPADKLAASAPSDRCALPAGTDTTTGDLNGDDFRRVTFSAAWRAEGRTQTFTQSALIVNPTGGLGPRIQTPFPASVTPALPITSNATTEFNFTLTTTWAAAVHWNADDGKSAGDGTGGPTTWNVKWPLGAAGDPAGVLDGNYTLSVQPFDDRNIAGETKVVQVAINRIPPLAVKNLTGGHDMRATPDWVDLEWSLNKERDIIGYRVYRAGANKVVGGGDDTLVSCMGQVGTWVANTSTSCQDPTPPSGQTYYYVLALDRDTTGNPREGDPPTQTFQVSAPNSAPNAPTGVTLNTVAPPTLNWSSGGSGGVAFYRVYRDGTAPANRVGKLTGTVYVDNGGDDSQQHAYYVSSVDSNYNESALVGPRFWTP